MAHIHAQVTLPYFSGLPGDVAVNNWSFDSGSAGTGGTIAAEIGAFLIAFYGGLKDYLSPAINTEQVSGKFYDRADPEPRTPFNQGTFDLGAPGSTLGLPEEVATCFSFRGNLESGQPPARRRGRVFLGPLNESVLAYSGRTVVDQDFIDDVFIAYNAAWDELTTSGLVHEVWSPTDEEGYTVTSAWMDDAFDTQRRRGPLATGRTTEAGPFGA